MSCHPLRAFHAIDILDVGLLRSGKITQAAIVGQDGEVWAESAGCNVCINQFPPPLLPYLLFMEN